MEKTVSFPMGVAPTNRLSREAEGRVVRSTASLIITAALLVGVNVAANKVEGGFWTVVLWITVALVLAVAGELLVRRAETRRAGVRAEASCWLPLRDNVGVIECASGRAQVRLLTGVTGVAEVSVYVVCRSAR